jgi:hypothetical protein
MKSAKTFKASIIALMVAFCLFPNRQTPAFEDSYCPVSTIPETIKYSESWNLQWDPNNPEEMSRETQVILSVIGGRPPYNWSVSGNGFSLADSQTQGLSNTLFADNTACGAAAISVTDSRSGSAGGSVRIPDQGQWVLISQTCEMPGAPTTSWVDLGWGLWRAAKIAGGQKQETTIFQYSVFGNSAFDQEDCDDGGESVCAASCTHHSLCWDPEGCDVCLTPPNPFPYAVDPCGTGLTETLNKSGPQAWKTDCVFCGPTYPNYNRWVYYGVCTCINSMGYYEWQCN